MVLPQLLSVSCFQQNCHHTTETQTRFEKNRMDQWGNIHAGENVTYISSVKYFCTDITLPLTEIDAVCTNCTSSVFISSVINGTIPPLSFTNFNFFNEIYMSNIGIENILPAAFNSLNHLKILDLSKNKISRVPDGLLNSLTDLTVIDFSSNMLENMNKHFLTGLKNLQLLNLSCNHLINFDAYTFYNTNNMKIDLSFNRLTKFNFESLSSSVQYCNLSHNRISEIMGCFSDVNIIKLDNNRLKNVTINSCDKKSSKIVELHLGFNLLTKLTNGGFDNATSLKYLYLENNNISVLQPDIFGELYFLEVLNLSNNHLSNFQHGVFDHVQNLRRLDLSSNDLWTTKRYFHSLSSLQELDLSNNHLNILDSSQLILDLPALKSISIDGNKLFCEELITIIQIFKRSNIMVQPGPTKSSSNINGIACNSSNTLEVSSTGIYKSEESILFGIKHLLEKYENDEKSMLNFFKSGFSESNFYKYLETFRRDDSQRFNETDIVNYFNKSFKNAKFFKFFEDFKQPIVLNNSVIDYFNKGFQSSNFVKYLERFQKTYYSFCENFGNSIFYNFFNQDFKNTYFYKYFENVTTPPQIVSHIEKENSNFGKLVNLSEVENYQDNYYGILIVFVILQTMLVFASTVSAIISLKLYYVLSKTNTRQKDQVELIES